MSTTIALILNQGLIMIHQSMFHSLAAKSKVLKREIISLKRKMKNATQLRNLVQSRKCAMSGIINW